MILITKSPENISPIQRRLIVKEIDKSPHQNLYFTTFRYKAPVHVFENIIEGTQPELTDCDKCSIVLITGIANPGHL